MSDDNKRTMDHQELLNKLTHRLDTTDEKIAGVAEGIKELNNALHKYTTKTAVLESQMNGVIKVGVIFMTATVGGLFTVFFSLFQRS